MRHACFALAGFFLAALGLHAAGTGPGQLAPGHEGAVRITYLYDNTAAVSVPWSPRDTHAKPRCAAAHRHQPRPSLR